MIECCGKGKIYRKWEQRTLLRPSHIIEILKLGEKPSCGKESNDGGWSLGAELPLPVVTLTLRFCVTCSQEVRRDKLCMKPLILIASFESVRTLGGACRGLNTEDYLRQCLHPLSRKSLSTFPVSANHGKVF